jgi:ATP-dependent RNA helicase RhlE
VNKANKIDLLIHLLRGKSVVSALVFSRTKHGADKIAKRLTQAEIAGDVIHSNKSQNARELALSRFKEGQSRVLVATDIVARGIDIVELSHVINFDLPEVPEAYVHRIGRTARAGLGGNAMSFCDESEKKLLKDIEKLINIQIPVVRNHPYPLVVTEETPTQRAVQATNQTGANRFYSRPQSRNTGYKSSRYGSGAKR